MNNDVGIGIGTPKLEPLAVGLDGLDGLEDDAIGLLEEAEVPVDTRDSHDFELTPVEEKAATTWKFWKCDRRYSPIEQTFLRRALHEWGWRETRHESNWSLLWMMRVPPDVWPQMTATKRVNFIPGVTQICRKDHLHRNLTSLAARHGADRVSFWPMGFNLPEDMEAFEAYVRSPSFRPMILKPPNSACGRKIRLLMQPEAFDPTDPWFVENHPLAQEYVLNPLLLGGFKCTLRIYVLVTALDPLRIYVFRDGLVRVCSRKYSVDPSTADDHFVHLDSIDINLQNTDEFNQGLDEPMEHDGLRVSVKYLLEYLERTRPNGRRADEVWHDIHQVVVTSILSVESQWMRWVVRHVKHRRNIFDIFGYDILLDEALQVKLIEINHTPSMAPHTDLENRIKDKMIRGYLTLIDINRLDRSLFATMLAAAKSALASLKAALGEETSVSPLQRFAISLNDMDLWTLLDAELEHARSGDFERVFPSADSPARYPELYLENRNAVHILAAQLSFRVDELIDHLYHPKNSSFVSN